MQTISKSKIEIGMGATEQVGSDRYPYTVVAILSPTRIVLQRDKFSRIDNNGLSESQTYEFMPNPDAEKEIVSRRKNGAWGRLGTALRYCHIYVGHRSAYMDPSF